MATYGFTDAELQEGWSLMNLVGRVKLDAHTPAADTSTLEQLDQWENQWFPIASATLQRRFPAVHAQVFKNLSQTDGPAVAVSVRTFLERFDQMAAGAGAYGAEGAQAKALLETRGLMPSVLNQARGLLETIGKIATVDAVMAAQDPKALEKAESDLWAWYLEWSQIARIARPPTAGGRTWSASPKSIWRPRAPCARARRQRVHRTERSTSKASNGSTR
ncbi:MAG: hypothetical protein KF850_26925, partial [Labilithrix sp.]|nr:hypothetical protein [Labilithrix sp.]